MARESMYGDVQEKEQARFSGNAPGQGQGYQVQRGDNLTKIASRQLGAGASQADIEDLIARIAKDNQISDVNRIQAGANLRMPPPVAPSPAAPGSPPPIDASLAGLGGTPDLGMAPPMPSPYMPRGGEIPQSFPVPPGPGSPLPMPNISPPSPSDVRVSPNTPPGFSISDEMMYGPGGVMDVSAIPQNVLSIGGSGYPPPASLDMPQEGVPVRRKKKKSKGAGGEF